MRLIDADALNKMLQERVGSTTDDKLYEVNLCIIDAPTIDAIPVAWVEEQRDRIRDIPRRGKGIARIIDWLLAMWRKEQEEK